MTRNELITKWCAAEGGKVSALDAPQAREAYAKLRAIVGHETGVDLDDVINHRYAPGTKYCDYAAYRVHTWSDGKPAKPARKRG